MVLIASALLLFLLGPTTARATHLAGSNITYACIGSDSMVITLDVYRDCSGIQLPSSATLAITNPCGNSLTVSAPLAQPIVQVSALCANQLGQTTCAGGVLAGFNWHRYEATIDLNVYQQGCAIDGAWNFSYSTCCRNPNTALDNSPHFHTFTTWDQSQDTCNQSPVFPLHPAVAPIPQVCVNQTATILAGATDPDGDSLAYSLVNAYTDSAQLAAYLPGLSPTSPVHGTTSIDAQTGTITMTPTLVGSYVVNVLVEEFDANGNLKGTILKDFMVQVTNTGCGQPPVALGIVSLNGAGALADSATIITCAGGNACFDVVFNDPDTLDSLTISTTLLNAFPGATLSQTGSNPATATICLTLPATSGTFHYPIVARDDHCPVFAETVLDIEIRSGLTISTDTTICQSTSAPLQVFGDTSAIWSVLSGDPMVIGQNFSCNPCANPVA
ncbi:MAG: hypothetical protein AAGB22_10945, partial [Bacteroidota bacterium]